LLAAPTFPRAVVAERWTAAYPVPVKMPTPKERELLGHRIEHLPGWQYKTTSAFERDHPKGWDYQSTQPNGFELNTDIKVSYDGEFQGHTLIAPGVIRNPNAASGPLLVAHWRRRVSKA
jgi:hypothetical protein